MSLAVNAHSSIKSLSVQCGNTPLMKVAEKGLFKFMEVLLDKGADLNRQNKVRIGEEDLTTVCLCIRRYQQEMFSNVYVYSAFECSVRIMLC